MNPDWITWDARIHGETYTGPTPHFRPTPANGTRDRDVWQSIFVEDEYHPPFFKESDAVVDIGAHIGSFSCLASMRGSRKIQAYEVDTNSALCALDNARKFEGIQVFNAAVVRSDNPPVTVKYSQGSMQTGWGDHEAIAIPFDKIISDLGRIRFLKIDCEGSEFPILYTAKLLDRIDEIAGEFHEGPHFPEFDCTMTGLAKHLANYGFYVYHEDKVLGNFYAKRTPFEGKYP